MNQQQAQAVIAQSKQIDTFDFEETIKQIYPDRTDLEKILVSELSLHEFLYLSKRTLKQFISELKDRDNFIILPFSFTNIQLGQGNLEEQIATYFTHLSNRNIPAAENVLLWLINYQVENGFYNKSNSQKTEPRKTSDNIDKLSEKLALLEINIENKLKESQSLYVELENHKKDIQILINQKRDELTSITASLATSTTQTNQINELLTKSTEQSSRLNTIVEQQEVIQTNADKKLLELEDIYKKTNTELVTNSKLIFEQIETFEKQVEKNNSNLSFIEGKREFFDERIAYLQNLIGQEVGANLFKTFKSRKDELEGSVKFWRWAVPAMTLATIGWIFFLFYNQLSITDSAAWWQAFSVNTVKSIPAIFLLFFSMREYRKERNFQEEYAFKSAVALTIDAYAGRLTDNVNKDKLIMDAVLGIYKTPFEGPQANTIKSSSVVDTLKSMTEAAKELAKNARPS